MNAATTMEADRVTLRPASLPDDELFLQDLYYDMRDDIRGIFGDENLERATARIQYQAQKASYETEFPTADHQIVLLDGQPIGRLLVERRTELLFAIDLALLSEHRNQGIGTVILDRLIREAADRRVPLALSVVKSNPALRLYERRGGVIDGQSATHYFLSWGHVETD